MQKLVGLLRVETKRNEMNPNKRIKYVRNILRIERERVLTDDPQPQPQGSVLRRGDGEKKYCGYLLLNLSKELPMICHILSHI